MFGRKAPKVPKGSHAPEKHAPNPVMIEALESRRFLSASVAHHAAQAHVVDDSAAKHESLKHAVSKVSTKSTASDSTVGHGPIVDTIEFSDAPTAVQAGLTALASTDSLAAPTATQTVYLGNSNGVETYTLKYNSSGTTTQITVDPDGNAVTAPTQTTTTWATLDGTGTGSNPEAAAEVSAIATALSLTAPTSATTVNVSTASGGATTFTVNLSSSSSTNGYAQTLISVNSDGVPVGNQRIPFSVVPTAVQNGINANLPTGATALGTTSTQTVNVTTENGVTFFSTSFTVSGTTSTVTVNSAGTDVSLPSTTSTSFSDIPLLAQMELQTLASADGFSGTISSTQAVTEFIEGNGTIIYSVTLSATNSASQAVTITVSSDQDGNPTVPPENQGSGGCQDMQGNPGGPDYGAVDFGLSSLGGGYF